MNEKIVRPLHHFVVVPTKRPAAILAFLSAYRHHLEQTGFDRNQVQFVVVNGAKGKTYREVKAAIEKFKRETPSIADKVHFAHFGWKDRLLNEFKKKKIPAELRKYFREISLSQLRNIGYLASVSLAHQLGIATDEVIMHQADDDVLPAYALKESNELKPLATCIFRSAEEVFQRHQSVHTLCGTYSGHQDFGVPRGLTQGLMSGLYSMNRSFMDPDYLRDHLDEAAEFFNALRRGVNLRGIAKWDHVPVEKDFSDSAPYPRPHACGGAMSHRMSQYMPVPPTTGRGDDLLTIWQRNHSAPQSLHFAPGRSFYHNKQPEERDLMGEAKGDFLDLVLIRLLSKRKTSGAVSKSADFKREVRDAFQEIAKILRNNVEPSE